MSSAMAQPADTLKNKFIPTGLRIGTDALAIIKSFAGEKFDGWEVNADVDFYRFYFAADYGNWARHLTLPTGSYENNGNYFRVGTDINFLAKDPDKNMVFIGFRYGQSRFDEHLNYQSTDPNYGVQQHDLVNTNLVGQWVELTTGLRVKVIKGFWMGYTIRLKFLPAVKGVSEFVPYDMPGYGLVEKSSYWGFNYQLFWRIPFRKG